MLRAAETERETRRQQILAGYHARFIDGPLLTMQFRNMHVQFDPRNLQPRGDAGTVYPNLRICDDWGILDAKNGALLKPDWNTVIVVAPSPLSDAFAKRLGESRRNSTRQPCASSDVYE